MLLSCGVAILCVAVSYLMKLIFPENSWGFILGILSVGLAFGVGWYSSLAEQHTPYQKKSDEIIFPSFLFAVAVAIPVSMMAKLFNLPIEPTQLSSVGVLLGLFALFSSGKLLSMRIAKALRNKDLAKTKEAKPMADTRERTPLHEAAYRGNAQLVKTLVETGSNVNARDMFDNTPLHFAVGKGHEEVALILLKHMAEVNAANEDLWTPLHLADTEGRARLVEILLQNGADINAKDTEGRTPLSLAQYRGKKQVVSVLRQHGGL